MVASVTAAEPPVSAAKAIEALYATGFSLHAQGRPRDALLVFRAMITLVPRDERGWIALGDCFEQIGKPGVALEIYGLGTAAAAPAPRCEIACGRVLRALERDDDAEDAFERAVIASELADDPALAALARAELRRPS